MNRKMALIVVVLALAASLSLYGRAQGEGRKGAIHITGPILGGTHGWPANAYIGDISDIGYVEEEFFIEGNAVVFNLTGEWTRDGKWTLERGDTFPYKTRMLVARPIDPAKFNGTVVVEWSNVSAGYDIAFMDIPGMMDMIDKGFAYVLASVQPIGVHGFSGAASDPATARRGLVNWDAQRYGSLHIPNDGVSYDIFTQVAKAVGPNRGTLTTGADPMGGLTVRKLIGCGGSQSGIRMLSYVNGIQPIENVYDALIPALGSAQAVDFLAPVAADRTDNYDPMSRRLQGVMVRDDLTIKVMTFNSEGEADLTLAGRRPDSDLYRHWEVAGATHGPPRKLTYQRQKSDRDGITNSGGEPLPIRIAEVDWQPVLAAALWHVHLWITDGTPPPSIPPIEFVEENGKMVIRRDQYGNAIGGVRLPELEVPYAHIISNSRTNGMRSSYTIPFSANYLKQLYPTNADYVAKVTEAANNAKAVGVILDRAAADYIRRARAAPIPEPRYPDDISSIFNLR